MDIKKFTPNIDIDFFETKLLTPVGALDIPKVNIITDVSKRVLGHFNEEELITQINVITGDPVKTLKLVFSEKFLVKLRENPICLINPIVMTELIVTSIN